MRHALRLRLTYPLALLAVLLPAASQQPQWPTYGGDPGGQRYTAATQITPANVTQLTPAWTFHTGSVAKGRPGTAGSSFEATPVLFHGALYLTSPFDEVFALDPATGKQLWSFDPQIAVNTNSGILTSRGVAAWPLPTDDNALPSQTICSARIFLATMDARLLALDAITGRPCADFGDHGSINLKSGIVYKKHDPYFITSPPTVIGDVVIVGSGIGDNQRVDIESGLVRAFDVRSGRQLWQWEPLPGAQRQRVRTGAGNVWGVIAADPEHNLIYLPTGSPSPDFYGGLRPGDNRDANSVVALEATTGRRVWGFQVVHHDLWDYDVASEPLLFTWHGNTPALAITTKQGLVFLLNRLTGEPLFPVTERAVPQGDVPGETYSPTQPFQDIDPLVPLTLPLDAHLGSSPQDDAECHKLLSGLRYQGIYTPPSLQGSVQYPGNLGGVNWGSASIDPQSGVLYANTNRYAFSVTLVPHGPLWQQWLNYLLDREKLLDIVATSLAVVLVLLGFMIGRRSMWPGAVALAICAVMGVGGLIAFGVLYLQEQSAVKTANVDHFGKELSPQRKTPYSVQRMPLRTAAGGPCTAEPFGTVSALDLNTGKSVFQKPLGTLVPGQHTGTINLGGTLVTASGLLFTAASTQPLLRAFDDRSGQELWSGALPVPAQATPMSYVWQGRQYVVIAAGGHGGFGTPISDALIAFALPAAP
jgi:quinoprotein glucose dehydrogenase